MQFKTNSPEETMELGQRIGQNLRAGDVLLLTGDLSAGKTTLTKGIGRALGIKKVINSPTFTIVKEYTGDISLYHLDLYRLDGLGEDYDLEEYFEGDGICVVEWPYQVSELLPKEYLKINIIRLSETERLFELEIVGKKYEGRNFSC